MPTDNQGHNSLPSYSSLATNSRSASGSRSARNSSSYSRPSRAPVEHLYTLTDNSNRAYATLRLSSYAASSRFLPSYYDGETISGSMELSYPKPETVVSVTVVLSGTIMATGVPPFTFWEHQTVLWNTSMGDPRDPNNATLSNMSSSTRSSYSSTSSKYDAKLSGFYNWPFSITLPTTCRFSPKKKAPEVEMPLPPSFSEKGAAQYVNYEINVKIGRGQWRIDNKIGTQFGFMPRTRPTPPSPRRRLAYQSNSPIPGPSEDPDGWKTFPPIPIRGTAFGTRRVDGFCTLSVATPLSYTRGTTIPLSLTITLSSPDTQALDLLASPSSPNVHLLRDVRYGSETTQGQTGNALIAKTGMKPNLAMKSAVTQVASAVWWMPSSSSTTNQGSESGLSKRLEGEIQLPSDIPPSFLFAKLEINYCLVMTPFTATGISIDNSTSSTSVSSTPPSAYTHLTTINITTCHAQGPRHRAYAPPNYQLLQKRKPTQWGLYNNDGQPSS